MDTLAFWLPLFLLFFSALLGALIKRRSCDHCLKKFAGKEVLIELDSEHWISGELQVFAQGIELIMPDEKVTPFSSVHSRIIHSSEVEKIPLFIRQAPDPDTRSGVEWHKEREKLLNPPFFKCFQRASLNSYNMLRDSFAQALKAIVGTVSKDTRLGKTKDADKRLLDMQNNLTDMVPNAWEPILEKYRGRVVAVERKSSTGEVYESGILEDYSNRFLLLRDVKISDPEILSGLDACGRCKSNVYDVLYSRSQTILRYSIQA